MRLLWTNQARTDQAEIYETIAEDNPRAAETVYEEIEERVRLLIENPRLGVRKSELGRGVRMLPRGVYLIFYETLPDTDDGVVEDVMILRVVHGHRDVAKIFGD